MDYINGLADVRGVLKVSFFPSGLNQSHVHRYSHLKCSMTLIVTDIFCEYNNMFVNR